MLKDFGQKIKNDVVLTLLVIAGFRAMIDFSYPQAIVFLAICGVHCYMKWLKSQEVLSVNDDIKNQIAEMKSSLSGVLMKQASKPQQMQQEIKRFSF